MNSITNVLGIPHRFSTAYYPQSNGSAENAVKVIVNTVRKMCGNDTIDIPIGTTVMIRLPSRATKLSPLYDGPFHVVTKTKNGTYVLKDEMNDMLHRDYVPSELKVVTIDEKAIEDQVYEVKEIRDHRGPVSDREYLVCWVGYGERENSWLKSDAFTDPETIRKYWVKINELKKLDEERKAKLVNDDVPKQSTNVSKPMAKEVKNNSIPNGKKRKQTVPRNTRNLRNRTRK
ncbi:hypothetical protein MFLAVUS_011217 [Mucor flavus]|uniref:Chromo domain-containing protein n=1 Tax=Mucor flavus TaxID=439312 RepID=A0ABP9ZF30_9FUNG